MSQVKVDYKKDLKKNRQKMVKKRKLENTLTAIFATVICVAIVGWIGYSVYTKASAAIAANHVYEYNEVNTDALQEYIGSINE